MPWVDPWSIPELSNSERASLKALQSGTANEAQQAIAFDVVVHKLSGADRISFAPGGDDGHRKTDFAEGRRWVGLMVLAICQQPVAVSTRGAPPIDLPNSPTPKPGEPPTT